MESVSSEPRLEASEPMAAHSIMLCYVSSYDTTT